MARRRQAHRGGRAEREWTIADQERLSSVENLYRLSLNATKAFTARNLKISAEDLDLTLPEGSVFVGDIDHGVTAVVLIGRGHAQLPSRAGDRKGAGQDLLRQRNAGDAVRRRVPPGQPGRVRDPRSMNRRCSRSRSTRASCAARRKSSARNRRNRSSSTSATSAATPGRCCRPGRFPRRDADAAVRHADLRAVRRGGRGHHALRSQAAPQHRALSVAGQAGAARPASTTRTTSSTTTSSTTTSTSRRRPTASGSTGARAIRLKVRSFVARHADAAARRLAGRAVDRQLRARPAVRHPREEPEHARRQPADGARARQRDDADDRVRRPARAAGAGARDRSRRSRGSARGRGRPDDAAGGAELPLQQPELLVSAGAGHRLRDRADSHFRSARRRLRRERRAGAGFPTIVAGKDPSQNRKLYVFTAAQPLRYLAFILSRFARAETTTIAFGAA